MEIQHNHLKLITVCVTLTLLFSVVSAFIIISFKNKSLDLSESSKGLPKAMLIGRPWGPEQAIGEPNTFVVGDYPTAWASLTEDEQDEWLALGYANPILIKKIMIYETHNPGAVYKITKLENANLFKNEESILWENRNILQQGKNEKRAIEITLDKPTNIQMIKLYIASTKIAGWNEIDAVGLLDTAGQIHWAVYAEASSSFAEYDADLGSESDFMYNKARISHGKEWGPEQATGKPDAPPFAGDHISAWASLTEDDQDEWLILTYDRPIQAREIMVHETFNPGALYKITKLVGKEELVIWQGSDPVAITRAGGGIADIVLDDLITLNKIKLYFQSTKIAGWNEIDAVGIKDVHGNTYWAVEGEASSSYAELMP